MMSPTNGLRRPAIAVGLGAISARAGFRESTTRKRMAKFTKGMKRPPGAGRKPGAINAKTRAFQEAVDRILESPDTEAAFLALRDSDDATDRSNFWRLAGKRVATIIDANLSGGITARVIDLSSDRKDDDGLAEG